MFPTRNGSSAIVKKENSLTVQISYNASRKILHGAEIIVDS
jgi:hypothetical protein